jgi:hypothetical protein
VTAPRTGLHDVPVGGFGFMEPRYAGEPPKTYSAASIGCPTCHAPERQACSGALFCPERIAEALRLSRAGGLPEAPVVFAHSLKCAACHESNYNGYPLACDNPLHRCGKRYPTGRYCRLAVASPGSSRLCDRHTSGSKWNSSISV